MVMMNSQKWARPKPGAHGLRRGAWYRVVNEMGSQMVVLDVSRNNVPVPRDMLVLTEQTPDKWTVVSWQETQRGAMRASESETGLQYAVCPSCRSRSALDGAQTPTMTCQKCGNTFPVDWEHPG